MSAPEEFLFKSRYTNVRIIVIIIIIRPMSVSVCECVCVMYLSRSVGTFVSSTELCVVP